MKKRTMMRRRRGDLIKGAIAFFTRNSRKAIEGAGVVALRSVTCGDMRREQWAVKNGEQITLGFIKSLTGGSILNLKARLDDPQRIDGGGGGDARNSCRAEMHRSPNISITAAKCRFCLRVCCKINGARRHNRAEERPDLSDTEESKSGAKDAYKFKMQKNSEGAR